MNRTFVAPPAGPAPRSPRSPWPPSPPHRPPPPTSTARRSRPGDRSSVPFKVGHGCDGEATPTLEIQVPADATDPQPDELEGWTGSVDGNVVTFDGGELPDGTELDFPVTFTAPSSAMTLYFPVIQTCGDVEVAWTSQDPDDEHPAPIVTVVGSAPGTTTPITETSVPDTTVAETPTTEATAGGAAPTTTEALSTIEVEDHDATADEDEDDSNPILWIAIGVAIVGGIGAAIYSVVNKKKDEDGADVDGPDAPTV